MRVSIDPGMRGSGWAVWHEDGLLLASGQLSATSSRGMTAQIAHTVATWRDEGLVPSEAIIEDQYIAGATRDDVGRDDGDGGGDRIGRIVALSRNAGAWEYAVVAAGCPSVYWVQPSVWKPALRRRPGQWECPGTGADEADAIRIGRWRWGLGA